MSSGRIESHWFWRPCSTMTTFNGHTDMRISWEMQLQQAKTACHVSLASELSAWPRVQEIFKSASEILDIYSCRQFIQVTFVHTLPLLIFLHGFIVCSDLNINTLQPFVEHTYFWCMQFLSHFFVSHLKKIICGYLFVAKRVDKTGSQCRGPRLAIVHRI